MTTNRNESMQRLLNEDAIDDSVFNSAEKLNTTTRSFQKNKTIWVLVGILIATNLLWSLMLIPRISEQNGVNFDLRKLSAPCKSINLVCLAFWEITEHPM